MFKSGRLPRQLVGNQKIPIVDSCIYINPTMDEVDHSDVNIKDSLANIISRIDDVNTTIVVSAIAIDLGGNTVTCPANVCLKINKSGSINNGTITVNGPLDIDVRPIGTATLDGRYTYRNIPQVTNLTTIKTLVGNPNQPVRMLAGTTVGDGQGGMFYYDSTSTATGDDIDVIEPTGIETGRWIRSFDAGSTDRYSEPTMTDTDLTIDYSAGKVQKVTQTANIVTFDITNCPPAGQPGTVTLIIDVATFSQAWPDKLLWAGGEDPTLTGVCIIKFITVDGGTTIYGIVEAVNLLDSAT